MPAAAVNIFPGLTKAEGGRNIKPAEAACDFFLPN